jgi:hypothetical protein
MLDITKDTQAMTTFRRNPAEFLKQLKKHETLASVAPLMILINRLRSRLVSAIWSSS